MRVTVAAHAAMMLAVATGAAVAGASFPHGIDLMERKLQEALRDSNILMDGGTGMHRQLQDSPSRECNQVIGVTVKELLTPIFTGLVDVLVTEDADTNAFLKASITSAARYDVVVTKICASCAEILDLYAEDDLLDDGGLPDGFSTYCAPERFHHDAVVSGALFQPYNATSNTFVPGEFKGALSGKLSNSSNFFTASERWPQDFVADFLSLATTPEEVQSLILGNLGILLPAFTATTGAVSIMADYVGYGENYMGTKSYGSKRAYQLSSAVLWLKAAKDIPTKTEGCVSLQNAVSIYGFSEGGYSAAATAAAMNDLGVQVLTVFAGGAPFRGAVSAKTSIDAVSKGTFNPVLYFAFPLLIHSYSSTNPDQLNTGFDQDLVASEWRDTALGWVDDGLPGYIVNSRLPDGSPLGLVAEKALNGALTAAEEGFESFCTPEFADAHPDLFMEKLCEAFDFNTLIGMLEAAPYPMQLCHSPQDDVVSIENLPNITANPNLSLFDTVPVVGTHEQSFIICYFAYMLPYLQTALNDVLESEVDVCPSAFPAPTSSCDDEDEGAEIITRKPEKDRINCEGLDEMDEEAIAFHCESIPRARKRCPVTCNMCLADAPCSNDNSKMFRKFGEPLTQTCKWLKKRKPKAVDRLCRRFSNIPLSCPKTCGSCEE